MDVQYKEKIAEEILFESIRKIANGYIPKSVLDYGVNRIDVLSYDEDGNCFIRIHVTDQHPFRVEYKAV